MVAAHAVDGNFNCHLSGACRSSNRADVAKHPARGTRPARVGGIQNDGVQARVAAENKKKAAPRKPGTLHRFHDTKKRRLLVVFGLDDFAATVETVRADVVAQVRFAGGRLDSQVRGDEEIVRTVHAALGRGLLILLNCHDDS
jgi:hypothetical protein